MKFATMQDHLGCGKELAIERAAEMGLDGIEWLIPDGVHNVGADGMHLDMTGLDTDADEVWSSEQRAQIQHHAEERHIALPSICPTFLNFRPGLVAEDPEERAAVADIYVDLVAAAGDIGADTILIPFFLEAEIESDAERDRMAEAITPAMDAAEAAGVTLAIENTLPAEENLELLKHIDSPAAGIYYDVANTTAFGFDPAEEIRTYGDTVSQVHFKDRDETGTGTMLGDGLVEFERVGDALEDVGYDDWIILETMFDGDPIDAMVENLRFARGVAEQ
jgi:sugar phosphate isomerase/epimerase